MLIYDCEIIKAIPTKERIPGIEYCSGWNDHANMGISVICAYDYRNDRYRVFLDDGFRDFEELAGDRTLVSFNGISFDDRLCKANGIDVETRYDLLVEVWAANDLGPKYAYPSHYGYGLGDLAQKNLGLDKTGQGALAPVLWQQGKRGAVIDYCLQDVHLTKLILDMAIDGKPIDGPRGPALVSRP